MTAGQPLLRRQLLVWLLLPLMLLLVADTLVSYRVALSSSQRVYDRGLAEVARELAMRVGPARGSFSLQMEAEARRVLLSDALDSLFFDVSTADGRRVAGDPITP